MLRHCFNLAIFQELLSALFFLKPHHALASSSGVDNLLGSHWGYVVRGRLCWWYCCFQNQWKWLNMAEELLVVLSRSENSGFGFSLLGKPGLPPIIYNILEDSPAAESGEVRLMLHVLKFMFCSYLFVVWSVLTFYVYYRKVVILCGFRIFHVIFFDW